MILNRFFSNSYLNYNKGCDLEPEGNRIPFLKKGSEKEDSMPEDIFSFSTPGTVLPGYNRSS